MNKVSLSDQVFSEMKEQLLSGKWSQGSRLPSEAELCDMYKVSRTTIRQALKNLNALGLIETRTGAGSYAKELKLDDNLNSLIPIVFLNSNLGDVFEYRQIIEIECARLASRRNRPTDIFRLKELQHCMEESAEQNDREAYCRYDLEFHYEITKISGNSLIVKTYEILKDALIYSMEKVIGKMGYKCLKSHEEIISAIENRDEEKTVALMKKHLKEIYNYFS